ncbi:MAG: hypothetical protein BWK80_11565, partial [Desulfobacteraceae bacterium IS3]
GGNINIKADEAFIRSSDSRVDASSQLGIDGTVYVEAPDENVSSGLTLLPKNFMDVTRWLRVPCALRTEEKVSRFVITGRDAIYVPVFDNFPLPSPRYPYALGINSDFPCSGSTGAEKE